MIMAAVKKSAGGFKRFNGVAKKKLRQWIVSKGERMLRDEMIQNPGDDDGQLSIHAVPMAKMLAILKYDEGDHTAAQNLLNKVLSATTSHYGSGALHVIDERINLAEFLRNFPARWKEARFQYEAALDLLEENYGDGRRRQFFDVLNQLVGFLEELQEGSAGHGVCKICKERCADPDGHAQEVSQNLAEQNGRLVFALQDWKPSGMSGSQRHSLTRLTQSDPMDILDLDDELVQARTHVTSTTVEDVLVQSARRELIETEEQIGLANDNTSTGSEGTGSEALHGWRTAILNQSRPAFGG